jgi:hypothetical protein
MIVDAPERAARLAAMIFVSMPPRPIELPAPPAIRSRSGSPAAAVVTSVAAESSRGSAVNNPCWSVSRTRTSASTRFVTSAPSVSLSPNRISSVVTVSFSLITGMTRSESSVVSVVRAFR